MIKQNAMYTLPIADDDERIAFLHKRHVEASLATNSITFVLDGEKLLKYLQKMWKYRNIPKLNLILMDLNMSGMNEHKVLQAIKQNPDLRAMLLSVLSASQSKSGVTSHYELGTASYIKQPIYFVLAMKNLKHYWFEMLELTGYER